MASVIGTVSATCCPTVSAACAGDTITAPTGRGCTVISDVPDRPPLLAVMVALPVDTPTTSPVDDTVATDGALLAMLLGAGVAYDRWLRFAVPGAFLVAAVGAAGIMLAQ